MMDWGVIAEQERSDWIEAAVLIPVYQEAGEDFLILTKRTEVVLHHKGQICFPGGAKDPGDTSLWHTALRETQEEIGIDPKQVTLVRELERQYTPSGFRVTPFIGRLEGRVPFTPNPHEIETIFTVPFRYFQDGKNVKFISKAPHFFFEGHEIWGMTGRVLCEMFGMRPDINA